MSEQNRILFNGKNYKAFRIKLMDYLLLNDLLPAVETTLTTESLPLALIADKKAQAHIRLKLGDNIISQIQDCKTSKAIIGKLDTIYMRRNIMALGMLEEE